MQNGKISPTKEVANMNLRRRSGTKILMVALVLSLVPLLLGGCAEGGREPIKLADAGWDSLQVHNAIFSFIAEHGYGYPPCEIVPGSSPVVLVGVAEGDIDVHMETWSENYGEAYTDYLEAGEIVELGLNFDDNFQGWLVPTYMIEGDPERGIEATAPDLKSVFDLPEYWELFKDPEVPEKGRFHNSIPGWKCTEHNTVKLETYGLNEYYNDFICGSDAALSGAMVAAYEKGEPWLGYYWAPTWLLGMYDMTLLEEPPYDPEVWERDRGCEYMAVRCTIMAHPSFVERAPELVEVLQEYQTTVEQNNKVLAYMQENEADAAAGAVYFLKEYESVWSQWVPSEVASKVKAALS
jgi:glycine betaine/proline transport system substrate-binding protein